MNTFHFLPEVLYADTAARRRWYGALSQRYAAQGDAFGAVHAAFAADVNTVQAVMWERVMVACPEPDEQFDAIADTVSRALGAHARAGSTGGAAASSATAVVEQARRGMGEAFDPVAQRIIAAEYLPLDHLAGLPAPDLAEGDVILWRRLHGEDPSTVSARRRAMAGADLQAALALAAEGRLEDAVRQAWRSDWATFEAYLIEAAAAVGDAYLVTTEMRWAMAVEAVSAIPALPHAFVDAVETVRGELCRVLGVVEAARLREQLTPLTLAT